MHSWARLADRDLSWHSLVRLGALVAQGGSSRTLVLHAVVPVLKKTVCAVRNVDTGTERDVTLTISMCSKQ
jgi:hypothetical protein